jgi:endonuclease/exonuclease/phosphatase family metal-dependent hydrolase
MVLSILQLNIFADNYWNKLVAFLSTHDFDVLQLQEVAGNNTECGQIQTKRDCYEELKKILGNRYNSELAIADRYTSSPTSYLANATFFKKAFVLEEKNIFTLFRHDGLFPSEAETFEDEGRVLLHLKLRINGKTVSFLNTHFAWARTNIEEAHQTKQAKVLLPYVEKIAHPLILSGDFNLTPDQPTIQKISKFLHNLTAEYTITNTLNPRNHRAKHLFPKGLAVDYIFVSNDLKVKEYKVIDDVDFSDHFGLMAKIEI